MTSQVQTTDLALAQEIALDTDAQIHGAELALSQLGRLSAVQRGDIGAMMSAFQTFKAARSDVDLVYWLGADGTLEASFLLRYTCLRGALTPQEGGGATQFPSKL